MARFYVAVSSAVLAVVINSGAMAQTGPVATACKDDIAKYCAGLGHGNRQTRSCLEANVEKVSASCKSALETTGGGRGRQGRQ
ncbi:MAG: cysteine rich repeat-containing protein [Alphaproteobacteria bacterium]|nr:cysteine rich repeat-containing protein [Alphaproteobacteria bacterium]